MSLMRRLGSSLLRSMGGSGIPIGSVTGETLLAAWRFVAKPPAGLRLFPSLQRARLGQPLSLRPTVSLPGLAGLSPRMADQYTDTTTVVVFVLLTLVGILCLCCAHGSLMPINLPGYTVVAGLKLRCIVIILTARVACSCPGLRSPEDMPLRDTSNLACPDRLL